MISRERLDELRRKADLTCSFQVTLTDDEMYALLQAYETIGEITQQLAAKDAGIAALKAEMEGMRTYSHETVKGLVDWRDKRIAELEAQNKELRRIIEGSGVDAPDKPNH